MRRISHGQGWERVKPRARRSHRLPGHCFADRSRVNPKDSWWKRKHGWDYGPRSYDDREPVREAAWYEAIAETVAERFAEVGEAWFARDDMEWRGEYRG